MLVESVRAFVERELYPHEDLVEKLDEVPDEIAADIQAKAMRAGFYAANMPAEHGGGGLDALSLHADGARARTRRLRPADVGLASRPTSFRAAGGEQIERYLIPTIKGERHDCLAMTEPGAGSDVRSMKTRAERAATAMSSTARNISSATPTRPISSSSSPRPASRRAARAGGRKSPPSSSTSARPASRSGAGRPASRTAAIISANSIFDDCFVAGFATARRRGARLRSDERMARRDAPHRRATSVGRARRVLDSALDWASTRQQFGEKIGRFQGVSFQLADMATEIEASDLLTLSAPPTSSIRERRPTRTSRWPSCSPPRRWRASPTRALQIYGGMGLMTAMPIERWWRDARVERIWDGTSEIQRHIISRALLRPRGC